MLALDQGPHHLEISAVDGAGNPASPVAVEVDLDTEAPLLGVTAPNDGTCLGQPTTVEYAADDPHLDEVSATLDGVAIPTGHVVDTDGTHQLTVTAVDACGLQCPGPIMKLHDTIAQLEPGQAVAGQGYLIPLELEAVFEGQGHGVIIFYYQDF